MGGPVGSPAGPLSCPQHTWRLNMAGTTQKGSSRSGGALCAQTVFRTLPVCPALVDGDGSLLIEALGLIVPVRSHGPKRSFNCTCVVAAEKKLTTGGLEYNADIRLGSATIAPVSCVQRAVCNCCCHVGLLSSSVHPYNQHSTQIHGKDGSLSLSAYHMCVT